MKTLQIAYCTSVLIAGQFVYLVALRMWYCPNTDTFNLMTFVLTSRLKKLLFVVLTNAVLLFIGVELLGNGLHYAQHRSLFYGGAGDKADAEERHLETLRFNPSENTNSEVIFERLHPFFGYVLKPNAFPNMPGGLITNNYGFVTQVNYPYIRKSDKELIIGVLGGSVANDLAVNTILNQEAGKTGFAHFLKDNYPRDFDRLVVINMSNGGYKQPQQLIVLSYFLTMGQEFDLIINIDGFNEVALSNQNNSAKLNVTLPSVQHLIPLINLAQFDINTARIAIEIHDLKAELALLARSSDNCKTATCYAVNHLHHLYVKSKQVNQLNAAAASAVSELAPNSPTSLVSLETLTEPLSDDQLYTKIARHWVNSSLSIKALLDAFNIKYIHVLQPNQYFRTERLFTAVELRDFQWSAHPYKEGVVLGYPQLIQHSNLLRESGVLFFDATSVFDAIPETVYRDACCHYNDTGKLALEKAISAMLTAHQ